MFSFTYAQYLENKYNVNVTNYQQPLLKCKAVNVQPSTNLTLQSEVIEKTPCRQEHVIIPEFCEILYVSKLISHYLRFIPTLCNYWEWLMRFELFFEKFNKDFISIDQFTKIENLEKAVTLHGDNLMKDCLENMETYGDALLK